MLRHCPHGMVRAVKLAESHHDSLAWSTSKNLMICFPHPLICLCNQHHFQTAKSLLRINQCCLHCYAYSWEYGAACAEIVDTLLPDSCIFASQMPYYQGALAEVLAVAETTTRA